MMRLIDADELRKGLFITESRTRGTKEQIAYEKGWDDALKQVIVNAPTIDAEPVRHGKWIKVDDDEPIAYDCSECDAMVTRMYNYCPCCGAKMDGETT